MPLATRNGHEPTYYCHGQGCRKQFHEHPATAVTLAEGQRLGKDGLDRRFPLNSLWHYGPVYENMDTIVRVVGKGAHHSGSGATLLRDRNLPGMPATWFIECEIVASEHAAHVPGTTTSLPPCALVPREFVVAERTRTSCCCCRCCQNGATPPAVKMVEDFTYWKHQYELSQDKYVKARTDFKNIQRDRDNLRSKLNEIAKITR